MKCNVVRSLAGGGFEPLAVTKVGPGSSYKAMTVPELIGKQNVVAIRTAGTDNGIRCFICIPELGNAFAYGYGPINSNVSAIVQLQTDSYGNKAEYDPETGTFTTNDRTANYHDRWGGTFAFYAW